MAAKKRASRKKRKKGAIKSRRKKEFTYRGYNMEELKEMPFDEMLSLLPARIRRSLDRGLNEEQRICFNRLKEDDDEMVRTHRRDVPIIPSFVGKKVSVYNGMDFEQFEIKPEMIGHYLGEFVLTRKKVEHSGPGVGATRSSKFLPLK